MWPLLLCPCSLVIVTLLPAEPVRLFVCFDRIASFIVNADQRIVQRDRRVREDFVPMVGLAKLLREPVRWLGLAVGLFAAGQTPLALFAKRQNKKLAEGELVFVAIGSDANGHGVLRHVTTQSAM